MAVTRSFVAGTATAVAPVAAVPTTAAQFALWNGEPAGGKVYSITSVSFTTIASCAAAQILQLLAHVAPGLMPVIGGTAGNGPRSTDGVYGGSRGVANSAVTIVAASGIWHPVGGCVDTAAQTATISTGTWVDLRGKGYYLTPGGILSLAVLCNAAGSATCSCFVTWDES